MGSGTGSLRGVRRREFTVLKGMTRGKGVEIDVDILFYQHLAITFFTST